MCVCVCVCVCADSIMLLVRFTAGQVQLIDPIKKELSKIYNEKVRALCVCVRVCVCVCLRVCVFVFEVLGGINTGNIWLKDPMKEFSKHYDEEVCVCVRVCVYACGEGCAWQAQRPATALHRKRARGEHIFLCLASAVSDAKIEP